MKASDTLHSEQKRFYTNPPCSEGALRDFEIQSKFRLPDDYSRFLRLTNGGEGYINSEQYAIMWRLQELIPLNEAYEAPQYLPGLFIFGSSGGGEALLFDCQASVPKIMRVPFVGADLSRLEILSPSFEEFIDLALFSPSSPSVLTAGQKGMEIIEIQPVILGGSPTDVSNKVIVNRGKHVQAVRYWNKIIRDSSRQNQQAKE